MRITSFAILSLAAAAAVFANSRPETTTYIDGNVTGVSPNTGGTLMFSDDKAMILQTGLGTVAVPYADISNAELGAVKENSHDVPLYKVWALHKRFSKTKTQLLIVNFRNDAGQDKSMTLELDSAAATSVLSDLETRSGKKFTSQPGASDQKKPEAVASKKKSKEPAATAAAKPADDDWWGDTMWKTPRNADKWSKPTGANAPEQQQ